MEIGIIAAAMRSGQRSQSESQLDFERIAHGLLDLLAGHIDIVGILQNRAEVTFKDDTAEEEINQLLDSGRDQLKVLQDLVRENTGGN